MATATLGVDLGRVLELDEGGERLTVMAAVGFPEGMLGYAPRSRSAERERERRAHAAHGRADDRRGHGDGDALQAVRAVLEARHRQQPQRPDRGPRPAVRGPQRPRPRAARVLRGRGRVPHRGRDAHHRRRRARPRGAGDAPRRAARPADRPAEPHARARPARACAGAPAARAASTSRSSCSTSTASR